MSKYYHFDQNNSGGFFIGPESIVVKASSLEEAETAAFENGVYYNGVSNGRDCECCGDRWYHPDVSETIPRCYGFHKDAELLFIDVATGEKTTSRLPKYEWGQ